MPPRSVVAYQIEVVAILWGILATLMYIAYCIEPSYATKGLTAICALFAITYFVKAVLLGVKDALNQKKGHR
jgi:uncharacterized membrane protein HdeD (DUF308 family)